ncbi:hypothetical protein HS088_TW05G00270 [Tripterygium wilfordii]|uniref:PTM/DIR17-like Tudor domain-containing protein n=1 Tax=Tripterygium wilfordii TaxID=458696 RepID=A0A7J7DMJ2_TRIWF|nr:dirigent protein 17-like [Tripterygium wilfordii]KAF5747547.1 hypothetical protein HS088_TW05G00270 [Tripterygium wilfordii]
MKNSTGGEESDSESSLSAKIFELVGEPAIVINGVPDLATPNDAESQGNDKSPGIETLYLGEWLEGREVKKKFGEHYYLGTVTKSDRETGWYRVLYEDGDSEDLDWNELEEVLLPLDITVPLKSLALKIIKKTQKMSGTAVGSS